MALVRPNSGDTILASHVDQYIDWLRDGVITDTPVGLVYSGSSNAVTLTQNGTGRVLQTAGTLTGNVRGVSIIHTHQPASGSDWSGLSVAPTFAGTLAGRYVGADINVLGTLPTAGGMEVRLASIGRFSTLTLQAANTPVYGLYFDWPTITLSGAGTLDTTNSANIVIGSAPASGYSIKDISAGKWQTGSGGLTVTGGGITVSAGEIKSPNTTASTGTVAVTTTAGSSTGTGSVIGSFTIPANTLTATGKAVRIRAWGAFAANGNSKGAYITVGGVIVGRSGNSTPNGGSWFIDCLVMSTGGSNQSCTSTGGISDGGPSPIQGPLVMATNITNSTSAGIAVTANCAIQGANGDVTFVGMIAEVIN